jgi:hypothetical protein
MINPRPAEKIIQAYEIKSAHGRGIFYITNFGVYVETQRYGLVLDISFDEICSYRDTKHGFRIEWRSCPGRLHYEFVVNTPRQVFDTFAAANKEFAQSVSENDALRLRHDQSRPDANHACWFLSCPSETSSVSV